MNIDRYTKGVLTVIAGALLYICVLLSGAPLSAQGRTPPPFLSNQLSQKTAQPVVIVGWGTVRSDGEILVTTVRDANGQVHSDPMLPVNVNAMPEKAVAVSLGVTTEHPLPVGLSAVTPGTPWEPIRTKVEPAPLLKQPGSGGR